MNNILGKNIGIKTSTIYKACAFNVSNFNIETEGEAYNACNFNINDKHIIYRTSKITPKKTGQFVTFWKRNNEGITTPFNENDCVDFYVINSKNNTHSGQFVFPKSVLIKKGILSTSKKDGKRGFRVYPSWDKVNSGQAEKTQKWQLNYFYELNEHTKIALVKKLYSETI